MQRVCMSIHRVIALGHLPFEPRPDLVSCLPEQYHKQWDLLLSTLAEVLRRWQLE
jgi:hypothetical protein